MRKVSRRQEMKKLIIGIATLLICTTLNAAIFHCDDCDSNNSPNSPCFNDATNPHNGL